MLATSDEWGVAKPDAAFFDKLVAVSGHDRQEIAYVGDRLDNDIAPAAAGRAWSLCGYGGGRGGTFCGPEIRCWRASSPRTHRR